MMIKDWITQIHKIISNFNLIVWNLKNQLGFLHDSFPMMSYDDVMLMTCNIAQIFCVKLPLNSLKQSDSSTQLISVFKITFTKNWIFWHVRVPHAKSY